MFQFRFTGHLFLVFSCKRSLLSIILSYHMYIIVSISSLMLHKYSVQLTLAYPGTAKDMHPSWSISFSFYCSFRGKSTKIIGCGPDLAKSWIRHSLRMKEIQSLVFSGPYVITLSVIFGQPRLVISIPILKSWIGPGWVFCYCK